MAGCCSTCRHATTDMGTRACYDCRDGSHHSPPATGAAAMYLARLRRLLWLQRSGAAVIDDPMWAVLNRMVAETFAMARELGEGDAAKALLAGTRDGGR